MRVRWPWRREQRATVETGLWDERAWTAIAGVSATGLPGTTRDYATLAGDLWLSSLVGPVLNWALRNVGSVSPQVLRPTGGGDATDAVVDDHPLIALLERPGFGQSLTTLLGSTILSLECAGNAYWLVHRRRDGLPAALQWYPHYAVTPERGPSGTAETYRLRVNGGEQVWPAADVVHFRHGLDPRNDLLGLSPLTPVLREIVADTEASNWLAGLLRNSSVPGLLLLDRSGALTDEQRHALRRTLDERTGGDRRGSSLVVSGDVGVERLGTPPAEFGVVELRKAFEARVCAALGLPAVVVGFLSGIENATDNKQREYHAQAWSGFLLPLLDLIADTVTVTLLSGWGGPLGDYLDWDTSGVTALREDAAAQVDRAVRAYTAGLVTRREARAIMGLEADEADDGADDYYRPGRSPEAVTEAATRAARDASGR